jgi:GT2 family glycosyltransferase
MSKLHVVTPVKDSMEIAEKTIESIMSSEISADFIYTVYNDFSSDESTNALEQLSKKFDFNLINLKDVTLHPSPNYLTILQMAQQRASFEEAHILIVESDVVVGKNTIQKMYDYANELENPGLIASITTDVNKKVNYPYLFAKRIKSEVVNTRKQLSFCCTLISHSFLNSYNFNQLNPDRTWHDYFISHKTLELGYKNYLVTSVPVIHLQHSIYPWMHLKQTQPGKYYWNKIIDKILNK